MTIMITCPKCNKSIASTDGFCENCGAKIESNIGSIGNNHNLSTPSTTKTNEKRICTNKLCTNYNVEYTNDENYCGFCGTPLSVAKPYSEKESQPAPKGYLVMPDQNRIEITPSQRLIGRLDLTKYMKEEELKQVSRGHVTVFREGKKYFVQDGKTTVQEKPSTNKTWIISSDGKQKEEITGKGKRELKDGDQINIAGIVTLPFNLK
jgi:FHA domain-containing protein